MFTYKRRVTFYETDGMKVVHHANYLKYFEEARVEYLRCLLYTSPSPRDAHESRMPSSA